VSGWVAGLVATGYAGAGLVTYVNLVPWRYRRSLARHARGHSRGRCRCKVTITADNEPAVRALEREAARVCASWGAAALAVAWPLVAATWLSLAALEGSLLLTRAALTPLQRRAFRNVDRAELTTRFEAEGQAEDGKR
jgi:hypothetical protein